MSNRTLAISAARVFGWKLVALTVFASMFVGILGLMIIGGASSDPPKESSSATTNCEGSWTGGSPTERNLTQDQLNNAGIIYTTAMETGMGERAAAIAIATALQESDLGADPSSSSLNGDGDVGVFQQRAYVGWYADGSSTEENKGILLDTAYAARTFLLGHTVKVSGHNGNPVGYHIPGLADINDWQNMSLTKAAQAVQRSAYPDAYAKHEPLAQSLITMITNGKAGTIICGPGAPMSDCPSFDPTLEAGLTPDAIHVLRCGKARWPQLTSFSTFRSGDPQDHGSGRAVDLMIPNWGEVDGMKLGYEIANWFKDNAAQYGITYIIWRRHIWNIQRDAEGWRDCATQTCYSGPDPTAAHVDHVHISVVGNAGNAGQDSTEISSGQTVTPLKRGVYVISSRYGMRTLRGKSNMHTGLDFAAAAGTQIRAVRDGTVAYAGWGGNYGNMVKIDHDNGMATWYAHMLEPASVNQGQRVSAGQPIGLVGSTGNSTGDHLHLEVRRSGIHQDPEWWFFLEGVTL